MWSFEHKVYVERLAAADESAWKDHLESMGNGPDIPKLFRTPGKVSIYPGTQMSSSGHFIDIGTLLFCFHRIY